MVDVKKLVAGAVAGFVSALVVDLHAWSDSTGSFDWQKALKRWVAGAVTGATSAAGLSLTGIVG